jgi:Predicted Rossmann fold nucleotide-binding protein
MKQVTIFCSASNKIDPKYNAAARELVRALHALGYGIISGGGARGTMGAITDESVRICGHHTAVLPNFMRGLENTHVSKVVWTQTMSSRKEGMREESVAAIALPGGIGTLDEFVETHVLRKLGRYHGRLIALNLEGFYNPYKALLDHFVNTGMLEPQDRDLVAFPETVEDLIALLK